MGKITVFSNIGLLLVDDEPFVRHVTAKLLNALGIIEVYEAGNGLEAIACIAANKIDLLITDIQMPEMNGVALIQQIRMGKTAAKRDLRTIVVTSFSYTEVLSSCLLLDVNGFLVKPITPDSARKKILLALNEQMKLHPAEVYLQVKADLSVIEAGNQREPRRAHAAVTRSVPAVPEVSGGLTVAVNKLQPGMVLLEDLTVGNGIKLLSKGNRLTEVTIHRITELSGVISNKWIRVKPQA